VRIRHGEGQREFADALPRTHEPLADRGLGREKGRGDFGGAEAAQRPQGEGRLRLRGELRVKADKHHPQAVIGDLLGVLGDGRW
jgi:hypothetical protein